MDDPKKSPPRWPRLQAAAGKRGKKGALCQRGADGPVYERSATPIIPPQTRIGYCRDEGRALGRVKILQE